jgi:peptidoglycan/LPS O-acetylase OafA/YrhL
METESAVGEAPTGDPGEPAHAYRPHLDGLRAVAVYLVVVFSAGSDWFSGGYIGIDVFFVLSGYLVTQLLMRDVAAAGSIRLSQFYSRRFRRLLPAAFVTLIVSAILYTAIASSTEVSDAVGAFRASFLYSANWYFIHQSSGYFTADISANPVLHFWSLAVGMQFFLIWPPALGVLFAATRGPDPRRRKRMIQAVVAFGAVASAGFALSLQGSNLDRAYYGTDTRAYELLAGALLALVPALVIRAARYPRAIRAGVAGAVGVLLVTASSSIHLDPIERGIAVTVTTGAIIVALEAAEGGIVKRLLSSNPVVYLGKISYGTYLWHWIVIVVALKSFHLSSVATAAIACLVASALASLSFEMLERPVRRSRLLDRHRRAVIAGGVAISVVSAVVLIPKVVNTTDASPSSSGTVATAGLTPIPEDLDLLHARRMLKFFEACVHKPVSDCRLVRGTGKKVLLIGDSDAWAMTPLFAEIARREKLNLFVSVDPACPWQRGIDTSFGTGSCRGWKDDLYRRVIPGVDPDLIVIANIAYGGPGKFPSYVTPDHKPVEFEAVAAATRSSVNSLGAGGRDVLIVEPIPRPETPDPDFDPVKCLSKATVVEECRYQTTTTPSPLERLYRDIAKDDPKVRSLDLDQAVCPLLPSCDPIIGEILVKWDSSHLTIPFAESLAPEVDTYLKSVGFLRR